MKGIFCFVFCFVFLAACLSNAQSISPALTAQRLKVINEFIHKTDGSQQAALNNVTVNAAPNFCWNIEYAGNFCGTLVEDYTRTPYFEIPTPNGLFRVSESINIVLDVYLFNVGTSQDTYVVKFINNNRQFSVNTGAYVVQDGLLFTAYYTFAKGGVLITSENTISDDAKRFNDAGTAQADPTLLCTLYTAFYCPTGSAFQNYSSFEDCFAKMTAINEQNRVRPCPIPFRSNTTDCRLLHTVVAGSNIGTGATNSQQVHCPHAATPSTGACVDECRPVCDLCDANALCDFSVTPYGDTSYFCKCKEGYTGNGQQCTKTVCTARYQCAGEYNYKDCNTTTNTCVCQPSFEWNASNGACECPSNSTVFYSGSTAVCLALGRCREEWHCGAIGSSTQVDCTAYGPLTALFPEKSCVPHYGYNGGFFVPVSCPSPKRQVWNSAIQGNVCLFSDECTADSQCGRNRVCRMEQGPSLGVGVCTSNSSRK